MTATAVPAGAGDSTPAGTAARPGLLGCPAVPAGTGIMPDLSWLPPGLWPARATLVARFTVPGKPQPKQRARVATSPRTGKRHGWTPEETTTAEAQVAWEFRRAVRQARPDPDSQFGLILFCHMPDLRVRDSDNLAKLVLDALNKILWKDDRQVPDLTIRRRLDRANPRTEATIYRIDAA